MDSVDANSLLQLKVIALATPMFIGLLAWSLTRNIRMLDKTIGSLTSRLDNLAETVGRHENRLTEGNGEFRSIREEVRRVSDQVRGLEDRERTRGCGASCRYTDERKD